MLGVFDVQRELQGSLGHQLVAVKREVDEEVREHEVEELEQKPLGENLAVSRRVVLEVNPRHKGVPMDRKKRDCFMSDWISLAEMSGSREMHKTEQSTRRPMRACRGQACRSFVHSMKESTSSRISSSEESKGWEGYCVLIGGYSGRRSVGYVFFVGCVDVLVN